MHRPLVILFVVSALLAGSESYGQSKVKAGFLGGLNVTDLHWTPSEEFSISSRNRANIGGFVRAPLAELFGFEARLLWLQTGVDLGASVEDGFSSGRVGINYLSVPILLRYGGGSGGIKPYVIGGVEYASKMSATATVRFQGTDIELDDDDVRSNNVALDIGGGIEIPASRVFLIIEGMYSHGLLNIDADEANSNVVKTRAFRLNVGIRF